MDSEVNETNLDAVTTTNYETQPAAPMQGQELGDVLLMQGLVTHQEKHLELK